MDMEKTMESKFVDYFGNPINVGDTVVFKSNDFKDDNHFYRAKVKDLIARKSDYGLDYCLLEDVESPHQFGKVKDGSKKCCQLCIVVDRAIAK
jgi:hypothetical protein